MTTDDTGAIQEGQEVEELRATERRRLRALVEGNMDVAQQLHADDFQLINPAGRSITKGEYLGDIASGAVNYRIWEPEVIAVRLHGSAAVLRYQADTEIIVAGQHFPLRRQWHTDLYEHRDGRWQVVWSQATAIIDQN